MENYQEIIPKVVDELINYQNEDKLSWILSYKDVLKKLNLNSYIKDDKLLSSVVTDLTRKGFDILDEPFSLEKYK